MTEEKMAKDGINILRSISMSLVGFITVSIISLWLGSILITSGVPKDDLKLIVLAFLIPAIFLGLVPLILLSYVSFPGYNTKITYQLNQSLKKIVLCLITGLINTILIAILLNIPIINLIGLLFFIIFSSIGLSNVCKFVGDKVYHIAEESTTPFKSLITGLILLEILLLLPIVGQILFIAITFIALGVAIIALFTKKIELETM